MGSPGTSEVSSSFCRFRPFDELMEGVIRCVVAIAARLGPAITKTLQINKTVYGSKVRDSRVIADVVMSRLKYAFTSKNCDPSERCLLRWRHGVLVPCRC